MRPTLALGLEVGNGPADGGDQRQGRHQREAAARAAKDRSGAKVAERHREPFLATKAVHGHRHVAHAEPIPLAPTTINDGADEGRPPPRWTPPADRVRLGPRMSTDGQRRPDW